MIRSKIEIVCGSAVFGLAILFGVTTSTGGLASGVHDNHTVTQSLRTHRDCEDCPAMAMIPTGDFLMGDPSGRKDEQPPHRVRIDQPFYISVNEVSFAEWASCVNDGGCERMPGDQGWGRTGRPVIGVSWREAVAYTRWLSAKSGQTYRLPTEAEWEYAARAGTTTQYWWGDSYEDAQAAFCGSKWDAKRSQPVGAFPPNNFGLHDTLGNVWEWVQDCYNPDGYLVTDGTARAYEGATNGQSCARVLRGGSWQTYPRLLRAARRHAGAENGRYSDAGLRVLREVPKSETSAHKIAVD